MAIARTRTRHVAMVSILITLCSAYKLTQGDEPPAIDRAAASRDVIAPTQSVISKRYGVHAKPTTAAMVAQPTSPPTASTRPPQPAPAPARDTPSFTSLIFPGIVIGFGIYAVRRKRGARRAQIDALATEAQVWMENAKATGKIACPNTGNVLIKKGERALLAEPSSLYELRADTAHHYLGTRVKIGKIPFYLGRSSNVSKKILKATSSGTLALTDNALIFAGSTRTARIKVGDIVGVEPTLDSIVINSGARASPLVFSVQNPFTWFLAIRLVASGSLSVETPS